MNDARRFRIAAALVAAAVILPVALLAVLIRISTPDTVTADVLLYSPVGAQVPDHQSVHAYEAVFTKAKVAQTAASTLRLSTTDPVTVPPSSMSLVWDPKLGALHVLGRADDPKLAARVAMAGATAYVGALTGQLAMQQPVIQTQARTDMTTPVILAVLLAVLLAGNGVFLLRPRTEPPGYVPWGL